MHSAVEEQSLDQKSGPLELKEQAQALRWLRVLVEHRTLLCWTLAGTLLRLLLVCYVEQVISPDGVAYVTLARSLAAGNLDASLSPYSSPLYPLLVALASLAFRDVEFAGRFVSVLAGGLLVIPAHRLMREWYGARVAAIGAALVALHPLLIYYSTVLLTEATYTLLFTTGVLAGSVALKEMRVGSFLLTGLLFDACYLVKPEAAGFLLLLLAATFARQLFVRTGSFKTSVSATLSLCAGFLLMAAPYLFYVRRAMGYWTISGKLAGHMWQGGRRASGELTQASLPVMPGLTTALVQLTKALRFEYEILNLIFPPTFVLLAGLCLFRRGWTRNRALRELYLFGFITATLAGYAVTLPNIRFLVPLLPLLLCWVSRGVVELAEWMEETLLRWRGAHGFVQKLRGLFVPLIIVALLASLLPLTFYLWRGDKWGDYYGQKRAGLWIKEHEARREPVIMSTVPVTAFYAGGRSVGLVDEEYGALLERARREGVSYVVVNQRDFRYMSLRTLLDEHASHEGLRLANAFEEAPGHKVFVYALTDGAQGAP